MSFGLKILIGVLAGLIFGFFSIISAINAKKKDVEAKWEILAQALKTRYIRLIDVLEFMRRYMVEFRPEIESLILLCKKSSDVAPSSNDAGVALANENTINYRLENIKVSMSDYPVIFEDENYKNIVNSIVLCEDTVGKAISIYNNAVMAYEFFLDTFPINIAAKIAGIKPAAIPFQVTPVKEFDDNYIDEDEV